MTIQEIFYSPAVREIELQIILLLRKSEKKTGVVVMQTVLP